jgi:hypothetical protein
VLRAPGVGGGGNGSGSRLVPSAAFRVQFPVSRGQLVYKYES